MGVIMLEWLLAVTQQQSVRPKFLFFSLVEQSVSYFIGLASIVIFVQIQFKKRKKVKVKRTNARCCNLLKYIY